MTTGPQPPTVVKIQFSYAAKSQYWHDNDGGGVGIKLLRGEHVARVASETGSELSFEIGPQNELILCFEESLQFVPLDDQELQAGDDPVVEQLRQRGWICCQIDDQHRIYPPLFCSRTLLLPMLKCVAVLANNPDIVTQFADLPIQPMPDDFHLEVNGTPVRHREGVHLLGHVLSSQMTRPPRPLPTADEFKWALRQYGAQWVSLVYRGDYAATQGEALIPVVLWASALELASYAARKRLGGDNPEHFKPEVYLKEKGPLGLALDHDDFIACCELWGCRNEMLHNGNSCIRTATWDGKTTKKNSETRPFTWEEGDRFRKALLRVIRAMH